MLHLMTQYKIFWRTDDVTTLALKTILIGYPLSVFSFEQYVPCFKIVLVFKVSAYCYCKISVSYSSFPDLLILILYNRWTLNVVILHAR